MGLACALTLVIAGQASDAQATVMRWAPVEELVQEADRIVHGTVVGIGTRTLWEDGDLHAVEVAELRILGELKPDLNGPSGDPLAGPSTHLGSADRVAVLQTGFRIPGSGGAVLGAAHYRIGEEVVVFLRQDHFGYRTLAMSQGKFRIQHGVPGLGIRATRQLQGLLALDRAGQAVENGQAINLESLEFLIQNFSRLNAPVVPGPAHVVPTAP